MGIFRKIQTKVIIIVTALLLLALSLFSGMQFARASAATQSDESDIVYIDTEVEGIASLQHPGRVYFGFKLTESDYDDFGVWETDYANTATYDAYLKYITQDLTYWKNFAQFNSEGVIFDQLYTYWNASSVGLAVFTNTVAHRSTLERLEYGFVVLIPEGTTFPSAEYAAGKCQGTPIMYRTTGNKAFYYDGTSFVEFSYSVAQYRNSAAKELETVNYALYYDTEREEVKTLISDSKAKLQVCFTGLAVQDTMSEFYAQLETIMTIADYEELATKKQEAKEELSSYFKTFSQEDYDETNWNAILKIKDEYVALVDDAKNISEVSATVSGVKLSADKVLTKDEQAAFGEYQASAIERVEESFDENLYREAERAQGVALVQEAKTQIENAKTYDEVDGWCLRCLSQIDGLKTQAEWEEEERAPSKDESSANTSSGQEPTSETEKSGCNGCNGSVNQIGTVFGALAIIMLAVIKNKKRIGEENER